MSTPLQRIQVSLLLASLNPRGLVGALVLLAFVPLAIVGLLLYATKTVKESFEASNSSIVSEIEANGGGDLWRELAPLDLGQWFGDRRAFAAEVVRECQARNVLAQAEEKRWFGSPEQRVCYSAAHPIPRPVVSKESAW